MSPSAAKNRARSARARTLIFSVFGVLLGVTVVRMVATVRRFDEVMNEYHARAEYNRHVEDDIERVEANLFDSETGVRGFLLTHDRRFLEPLQRASLTREQDLNDLVAIESDEPRAKAVADRIAVRAREWFHSVGEPSIQGDAPGQDSAAILSLQLFGKSRMDLMRADIGELFGDLAERRNRKEAALKDYRSDLLEEAYLSSALLIAVIVGLGLFLARRVDRPLSTLVSYVEEKAWLADNPKPLVVKGTYEVELLADLMESTALEGRRVSARAAQFMALTNTLAEGGDVDKLAETVARWTAEQLGAIGAVLWIVERDKLRLSACHGVDRDSVEKAGSGIADRVRASGKVERFDHLDAGGRVMRTAIVDVDPASLVVIPIRGRAGVVGILEIAGGNIDDVSVLGDAFERVGLSLEGALATAQIKTLGGALAAANDELRAQNEELRAQEEELRGQSDELVQKQKELASSNAQLEKGSRLKSEFLSDMSHELRTPLNAVIGFSELLLGDTYGALAPPQRERVGDIATAGRQLLTLVNDILDLSRIEAGRVDLQLVNIDIRPSVDDACTLMAAIAEKKKVKVVAMLPPRPLVVSADPDRVRQVVVNLLSNAIKFTPAGGTVEIVAKAEGTMTRVEVRDTGIGIAPEEARKLFVPFTQLKGGVSAGGAGLGLSISKRLVELMSGEIGLASTVGKGSIFYFTLPLAGEKEVSAKPIARQSVDPKIGPIKHRVLILEDDPKQIHAIEELLARAGHHVHASTGPASATPDIDQFMPELVVIDLGLPNRAGFSIVEEIAERKRAGKLSPKMAVVALTSSGLTSDERAALAKTVDLVAEKGVMTGVGFLDAIASLLEHKAERKKSRILVVDDSAINRSVLRAMLEGAGFEVVEADRAKEGIAMAQAAPPQLILMDVRMPDMNGLEATRALREDPRTVKTPIIAVSAQAMTGDRELALDAGCIAYVTKPVARQELLTAIGGALLKAGG